MRELSHRTRRPLTPSWQLCEVSHWPIGALDARTPPVSNVYVPLGILPSATWFIFAIPAILASMTMMIILGYWWSRGDD
jgi:hypothetical protein